MVTAARSDPFSEAARWLTEASLGQPRIGDLLGAVAGMLRAGGVHVARAHLAHTTLHPLDEAASVTWRLGAGVEAESYPHRSMIEPQWERSPIFHMIRNAIPSLRIRLALPAEAARFPVTAELAARDGLTDYLCEIVAFEGMGRGLRQGPGGNAGPDQGLAVSWASDAPGGFGEGEIAGLRSLTLPMALAARIGILQTISESLARCYIGRSAGPRVLEGAIRRGDMAERDAVVWYSDLRDSTELARALDLGAYVGTINAFFDATAAMVEAEGGEVVTFIGDAALAIFPFDTLGETGARMAALAAARRAAEALEAVNGERTADGRRALRAGIALHAGRLGYGNIGVPSRQSWSVVGPVVNETARLEGLTKLLGEPVVASGRFTAGDSGRWRPLGAHTLRGVPEPMDVFAPAAG
jgi:adenylate cyclase